MTEEIAIAKISEGCRIALGRDVCDFLGVSKGDKVVIYRTDGGEIGIRKSKVAV